MVVVVGVAVVFAEEMDGAEVLVEAERDCYIQKNNSRTASAFGGVWSTNRDHHCAAHTPFIS